MTTYLVAIHILVDTDTASPRSSVAAALEKQLDRCASASPTAGPIVDWAVAGEDLAASMMPVVIPADYRRFARAGRGPYSDASWGAMLSTSFPRFSGRVLHTVIGGEAALAFIKVIPPPQRTTLAPAQVSAVRRQRYHRYWVLISGPACSSATLQLADPSAAR